MHTKEQPKTARSRLASLHAAAAAWLRACQTGGSCPCPCLRLNAQPTILHLNEVDDEHEMNLMMNLMMRMK
jgi:hypothetical protein